MSYDHRGVRNSMAYVIDNFWPGMLDKIVGLRDSLSLMLNANAREKLADSFDTLQSIYVSIIDEDYVAAEDRILFKEQAMRMEDVFKRLIQGYMLQNGIVITNRSGSSDSDPGIDRMNVVFHESLRNRQNPVGAFIPQIYPAITLLIRFLRNREEHEQNKPRDHITGNRSFGNLYTLCSLFMLATYAYVEILEKWLAVEQIRPQTRS